MNKYKYSIIQIILLTILLTQVFGSTIPNRDSEVLASGDIVNDFAQIKSYPADTNKGDNIVNPYEPPKTEGIDLKDPSNIKTEVEYDPENNEYSVSKKMGNINYQRPLLYSFEEYQNLDTKNMVDKFWRDKANRGVATSQRGGGLFPQLHINSDVFNQVFGGSTIDIRPQGSVELLFGIRSDKQNDYSITPRLRRNTNFDFDMKIQMNVMAKIGENIQFDANYNTEATFDFEDKLKLKYEGKEDDIIQLIEAGHVSLPLNSTLITGSQSLFGIKSQLKFGKATVTSVFSQQESEVQNITVQGGGQKQQFSIESLDYEENKHFFIAQYFRDHYDEALAQLPVITSNINITKIEVWVTNIGAAVTENRNIIAFQDLGEYNPFRSDILPIAGQHYPSNLSNNMLMQLDTSRLRDNNFVGQYLNAEKGYTPGVDFEKVESARKLSPNEFTFNSKLGFISLNAALNPDQTLAVAFQYTILGSDKVFQVGEFSDQGISTQNSIIVKLLRSTAINTKIPLWNLMMKNVYNLRAYNVNREDFYLNILYIGNDNAVPTGFFADGPENLRGIPIIRLLGLDRLDQQNNPQPDGIFDFIDQAAVGGGTIQSSNGRIYFPVLEPFGSSLRAKIADQNVADRYCFDSLYTLTKTKAQQYPDKNKFLIEGEYKSQSGSDIPLNANNVPQGSVRVTAGGVPLVEGVDFTVDYMMGTVKIINEGILNSGTPINIKLENNTLLNILQQTMVGSHLDYRVNKDLLLGATIINLSERPITTKTNYGDEPISNTIWGGSLNYSRNSGLITKIIDKLPFYNTNAESRIRIDAEFAHFIPGHSRAVGKKGTAYIDDFEGVKYPIHLATSAIAWSLASTPQGQVKPGFFPEAAPNTGLEYGFNRAKLSWFIIDQNIFYSESSNRRPPNVSKNELSRNSVRRISQNELFPNRQNETGLPLNLQVFNLAYFPSLRGPYNYDVIGGAYSSGINDKGELLDPGSRWAGIMRKMETSDFEASNIEYITFWLMDPFTEDEHLQGGELYFNLGDISEDLLRDGRKSFEQGLPIDENVIDVDTTIWGRVPSKQAIINGFSNEPGSREFQDVGYDGLRNEDERAFFNETFLQKIAQRFGETSEAYIKAYEDPSSDDFSSYVGAEKDNDPFYSSVINRYLDFNGPSGNSPEIEDNNAIAVTGQRHPNMEDINGDNTLNDQERYFQYVVNIRPENMQVGQNYITDVFESTVEKLPNGKPGGVKWYQFKIPVQSPDEVIGGIQDFKSIRFMRIFLKNFERPIVLRFATLELERGEWRSYYSSLLTPGEYIPDPTQNQTKFDISTLSIEENSNRKNVIYIEPPGIVRETNQASTHYQLKDEQSMVLKVTNLLDGDARGAYRTTSFDFRNYKRLKMFTHAEKVHESDILNDGDVTFFIRIGTDFTQNYYEYEIPLTITQWKSMWSRDEASVREIWPLENELDLELDKLVELKTKRNLSLQENNEMVSAATPYSLNDGKNKMTIVGAPSLSDIRAIMLGVRNPKQRNTGYSESNDDGLAKSVEVWVNELRLYEFNEKSGWAANARVAANLADLGNLVLSGAYSTPGFGSVEQTITNRQKEALTQFDIALNLDLGKFFPEKSGVRIPVHYDYSLTQSNPEYNPLDPDVLYGESVKSFNKHERDSIRSITNDVTQRQNLNFMNVRKDRISATRKPMPWDIENFDLSYAYSKIKQRNVDVEVDSRTTHRGGLGYNYMTNSQPFEPFKKIIKSPSLKLLQDFNLYYLPRSFSFRTDMNRDVQKRLLRNKSRAQIILEPSYSKRWDWNRMYNLNYDITRSLKLDYSANVNAYIYEPPGYYERGMEGYDQYADTVWNCIKNFGLPNRFNQTANINYVLPISKINFLNWISVNTGAGLIYRWEASPRSLQDRFGNSIENSRDLRVNASLRIASLTDKIGFLKKAKDFNDKQFRESIMKKSPLPARELQRQGIDPKRFKEDETAEDTTKKEKKDYFRIVGNQLIGVLLGVKDVSGSYSKSNGIMLPGFMPQAGVLGNSWGENAPGLPFIFGSQEDIRYRAATEGWLSHDTLLNNPFAMREVEIINFRANVEPLKFMQLTLSGDKNFSQSYQSSFKNVGNGVFKNTSEMNTGTYTSSYFILPTAFKSAGSSKDVDPVFSKMLSNRIDVARRLAEGNPNSVGVDSSGYPRGYGANSPEVLLYSFISAYTGEDPSKVKLNPFPKIPIPNWRLTYNAGQAIPALREYFSSFTINHAYRSAYSVGSFRNDINFDDNGTGFPWALDNAANFIPETRIDVVSITEQFGPFLGLDITMKNSLLIRLEYKTSRNLSLSFVNNQLTEVKGKEFVIGTGYRFKKVPLTVRSVTSGSRVKIESDLNVKIDFSIRDNITYIRKVETAENLITSGTLRYSINFSADYMLSQKLNLRFYYDHIINRPHLAGQIKTSNFNGGISLRFTLSQ